MMKVNSKILSLFCSLLLMVAVTGRGQDLPSACGGSHVRYGVSGQPSSTFNWEVTGGTILTSYNDSIDIEWDQTTGIKTIKVTEITTGNCIATPVYANVMVSALTVNIGSKIEICAGTTYTLKPDQDYISYNWSTGANTSSIAASEAGTYWVDVTNSYGCKGRDSAELIVNTLPSVNLGNDTSLCPGESLTLNAGSDGISYLWSTNENGSSIEVQPGKKTVWVNVTNDKGCFASDTIAIGLCRNFNIYNAFTPNDDNDNNTWRIPWLSMYPEASVEVFDRWGRLVYKSKSFPDAGWDGRSNGKPLPMDSYYYIINLHDGSDPLVGTVTIIR